LSEPISLEITDPRGEPVPDGPIARCFLALLNDPRDLPFLRLMALQSAVMIPLAALLFVPGVFRWWMAVPYLALYAWWAPPFILMLHNTSHRRLFRREYELLNRWIPWVLGPLFGETPETYFAHHVGMHHPENNLPEDLSSTMYYQRDRLLDFLRYFFRFFFAVLIEIDVYFFRHKRWQLLLRCTLGEFAFLGATAFLLTVNAPAALLTLVAPLLLTRFSMMAGNWGQHAFIDAAAPENCYRNSITCINAGYNRRCFNDGYHIGHHLKATRHWTELPDDLADNLPRYVEERAIVFDKIDFFIVWLLLMLKRYDVLARRVVSLDGKTRSSAEIEALLRERTQRIPELSTEAVVAGKA
jgi:hypothetical protein